MLVDIDEPIEAYKEQVFLGMDLVTSIIFATAFIFCIAYMVVSFFILGLPLVMGVYTCWIPGAVIVVLGKKMFMEKISPMEKRIKRKYTREDISYISTESSGRIEGYLADSSIVLDEEQDSEKEIERMMRLFKLSIAVIVLIFIVVIVIAVCVKKGFI